MDYAIVAAVSFALGFFIRHAYAGKFGKAEALADKAKSEWDARK